MSDANPELVGKKIGDLTIMDVAEIENFCSEHKPTAAILCIPRESAEKEVEKLISYGVRAFWNFTHYDLRVTHKDVAVENVHLGDSLTTLSYCLNSSDEK